MSKKVLIIIAEGFEEIEVVSPIDVLRRAEVEVTTAGLGSNEITGAHVMAVKTDTVLDCYDDVPDVILLPGGMPGAENLAASAKVKDLIRSISSNGGFVAAICASPALVLSPLGILEGKSATCYPTMETNFSPEVKFSKERVVQDGNIITSRGPGTALEFALKVAENLVGKEKADMVAEQMLFSS